MARSVTPHLMFEGTAEEAMQFYVSVIPGSRITEVERYGPESGEAAGRVKLARFELRDRAFLCIDSPIRHAFTFTPSISLFVECDDVAEQDAVFTALAAGGAVLMPLDDYGFSARFGWLTDRFGVSWQLNVQA